MAPEEAEAAASPFGSVSGFQRPSSRHPSPFWGCRSIAAYSPLLQSEHGGHLFSFETKLGKSEEEEEEAAEERRKRRGNFAHEAEGPFSFLSSSILRLRWS